MNEIAAAHVEGHMQFLAFRRSPVEQQVAGLQGAAGFQERYGLALVTGGARQLHAGVAVGIAHQAAAVEAGGIEAAETVRCAELRQRRRGGPLASAAGGRFRCGHAGGRARVRGGTVGVVRATGRQHHGGAGQQAPQSLPGRPVHDAIFSVPHQPARNRASTHVTSVMLSMLTDSSMPWMRVASGP